LAQDVGYNFDKEADFTRYKSYKWVDVSGGVKLDSLLDQQLRDAIDAELPKKGLSKSERDTVDLFVGYQVAIGQRKQITSCNSGWGYGPGWGRVGWYGGGTGISTTSTSTLLVGTLALDMYEVPKKQLVWRGIATKTIDPNIKPEKRSKNITKAVAKLLKNYPPKEKK
jgi:hypothetical protein